MVLETLRSIHDAPRVYYWRDKAKHEVDFILPRDRDHVDAIEVKWNADHFDTANLRVFRKFYPAGVNWVVSAQRARPFERVVTGLPITFLGIEDLRTTLPLP